ncbi:MAG: hypothetical protein RR672_13935 [Raoultibacter sp.]
MSAENPDGTVVSVIVNERALPLDECGFVALVNPNGEKQVCGLFDESCVVVLTGREDAAYGVAVNDYDFDTGSVVQVTNYYDVGIEQGERNFLNMPTGRKCVLRDNDKVIRHRFLRKRCFQD